MIGQWGLLVAAVVALTACAPTATPPPTTTTTVALPNGYLRGAECVVDLSYRKVAFDRLPDHAGPGCGMATALSVTESPTSLDHAVAVDCTLARQLAEWDESVVQPAAQSVFGKSVKVIEHYGGYVCRGMVGNPKQLSMHAKGDAIDIAGFELSDGHKIWVERDWREGGQKQAFLRQIAKAACSLFSVVLTPNTNADHQNHFHLDVGPFKDCSP